MTLRAIRLVLFVAAAAIPVALIAQEPAAPEIRTFPLQHLSNVDAAKLVAPYVQYGISAIPSVASGVYEAGSAVHAITVRAIPEVLKRVDSLLKANDRPRPTVILRFQLIAATDSTVHDQGIAAIDGELHNLFRFNGYRLLAQTSSWVDEGDTFVATLRGAHQGDLFAVGGGVTAVQQVASKGSVRIYISLDEKKREQQMAGVAVSVVSDQRLLSTGLSIPLGQTVVVGSGVSTGATPAYILTVRPELAPSKP
jgi:hypothetical protein